MALSARRGNSKAGVAPSVKGWAAARASEGANRFAALPALLRASRARFSPLEKRRGESYKPVERASILATGVARLTAITKCVDQVLKAMPLICEAVKPCFAA
jgi:hypothetical protein